MTISRSDDYWWHGEPQTIMVHTDTPSVIVRYPKPGGGWFSVKFIQKPNPMGFHAKLPGDKPRGT